MALAINDYPQKKKYMQALCISLVTSQVKGSKEVSE